MTIKPEILIIPLFLLAGIVQGQELIPNPGFEAGWACPEDYTKEPVKELIPYWENPNRGTPDYFHRCSEKAGIPDNFAGHAEAAEGDAYVGLILREVFNDSLNKKEAAREYLDIELKEQLEFRQLYCFNLKYRLASGSKYAIDGLGVAFTREKMKAWNFGILDAEPMVFNLPGHTMDNKNEWVELCGVFRARGREKYLTIGNFIPNIQPYFTVNTDSLVDSTFVYAYYYIDDLKLYKIENEFECGCMNENSMGYDWLADDPKSYFDYYYDHIEDMYQQELLAMNDDNDPAGNMNNYSSGQDNNDQGKGNSSSYGNENTRANQNEGQGNNNGVNSGKTPGNTGDNQYGNSSGNNQDSNNSNQNKNPNSVSDSTTASTNDSGSHVESSTDNIRNIANNREDVRETGNSQALTNDNHYRSERMDELQAEKIQNSDNPAGETREDILNEMRNAGEGFALNLPKVYFAFNQSELLPSSYPTMEYLSRLLKEEPNLNIEIRGHTDNIGSSRYNKKLSIERAKSVYDFLAESGIDKNRLKYKGYGNEYPIADNNTEFGRQLNRRVEIVIISN